MPRKIWQRLVKLGKTRYIRQRHVIFDIVPLFYITYGNVYTNKFYACVQHD